MHLQQLLDHKNLENTDKCNLDHIWDANSHEHLQIEKGTRYRCKFNTIQNMIVLVPWESNWRTPNACRLELEIAQIFQHLSYKK
jgi:hypothetical protein